MTIYESRLIQNRVTPQTDLKSHLIYYSLCWYLSVSRDYLPLSYTISAFQCKAGKGNRAKRVSRIGIMPPIHIWTTAYHPLTATWNKLGSWQTMHSNAFFNSSTSTSFSLIRPTVFWTSLNFWRIGQVNSFPSMLLTSCKTLAFFLWSSKIPPPHQYSWFHWLEIFQQASQTPNMM